MNKAELLQIYQKAPNNLLLNSKLTGEATCTQLTGITGSGLSFIAAAAYSSSQQTQLLVLNDKEEAAYILNDLENILDKNRVLFFPESYKKPYEFEEVDNANILLRAEVLNKINTAKQPVLIITYPEALVEKVVTKTHLNNNTIQVNKGEQLSTEFILDTLTEYEFDRVEYVLEPGQFAIRGGIIDVYSYANDNPYRIELFGNKVDSIRSFDALDQLSLETVEQCTIIPNVQTKLLQENRQSFLEFLPKQAGIWYSNFQLCKDRIKKGFAIVEEAYKVIAANTTQLEPAELYLQDKLIKQLSLEHPVIELGSKTYLDASSTIAYNFTPQPTFNKNFKLLLDNLQANKKETRKVIVCAENKKQIDRLYTIFEDITPPDFDASTLFDHDPELGAIHEGFIDNDLHIACYADHQIFERFHRFHLKNSFQKKNEALTLKELKGLHAGDYITHIDYGIGQYGGLETIEIGGKKQETIRLIYKDHDIVNISIQSLHRIAKFSGKEGTKPKINKLGTNNWATLKKKTKTKVKAIAYDLIKLYAKRKALKGFQYSADTYLQNELEASFIYEDTPDQVKATADFKRDMENPWPMDRLVCGDVGFGKTEIAVRAAFKAVCDSKQVAILVPTTILAYQHYKSFGERLKGLPCTVDYINRFKTAKEQKETLKKLAEGKIDILIGTHAIVGKNVKFKDLGLMIIDEEQKFGVGTKDKLKTLKANVDTLTLTATPIPRTLQFSMMGARDLSIINTPPPNRYPVQTELHTFNEELIRDAIMYEVARDGQVFFVHNRVQNIEEVAGIVKRLCPDVKVAIGHGQMDGDRLEDTMMGFVQGDYDVLVATTIIESGLDISNANTIIIHQAQNFGLSDLHQMRGRVGRSNKKAFCYLLTPPLSTLTDDARKRLKAIEDFSDLGSGFSIAMRDLDIRGAGDLLGGEQSGFINEIVFDMFQKVLDEAIVELRAENKEFADAEVGGTKKFLGKKSAQFVSDCTIDTDLEILLPDTYVNNIAERLNLYRTLDDLTEDEELVAFEKNLLDRFGEVPAQTKELIQAVKLRWMAMDIGFEKLILKNGNMRGYFIKNQDSEYYKSEAFTKVLSYVQSHSNICSMKEKNGKLSLSYNNINSIEAAKHCLKGIGVPT